MSVATVSRPYAEAMADVAIERNQVEAIDGELRAFAETVKASRELYDVFSSPIVSPPDKLSLLDALIGRLNTGTLTANLLRAMLTHYRLHYIAEVYEQFRRRINERKGLIIAEVASAGEIGSSEQAKLGHTIEQMTGKQVEFKFTTDPSLIGGVVTRIGSVVYDGSVRTQLLAIKERLKRGDAAI
jgi:F-type H+-transporting ATPase subunit delta